MSGEGTVPVIGKTSDGSWLQAEVDGRSGWISVFYTNPSDLSTVPVVDIPVVMADSGSGNCNSDWTEFDINDSYQEMIKIHLNSGGSANVEWTLLASAKN